MEWDTGGSERREENESISIHIADIRRIAVCRRVHISLDTDTRKPGEDDSSGDTVSFFPSEYRALSVFPKEIREVF